MPNWVYTTIEITQDLTPQQQEILNEIGKVGVCRYYKPMPEELNIERSSSVHQAREIIKDENGEIPKEMPEHLSEEDFKQAKQSFVNEKKYGAEDWYEWCIQNWGTKWGDCDINVNSNIVSFNSAWSPISMLIISEFAKDFPNFNYEWEEEQGFGERYDIVDGQIHLVDEWDSPNWEDTDHPEITELVEPHRWYKKGFYHDYELDDAWLGETFEEALENLEKTR